ncbi:MAG: glycogen/starch synthase [Elusimicrobiaceae bacterium]|nr:glycogen/starch synthase [Elusimicrobiaceae bacterium]
MNILLAASEVFPFCKTGGLADVAGALAQVLARYRGHKVAVFLPRYRNIGGGNFSLKSLPGTFNIPVGTGRIEKAALSYMEWGKVSVYFVHNPHYFDRTGLYRTPAGDFPDNDERFMFFSRAVLEGAKFAGFKPDVIHCNDWQTALIPAYLKTLYSIDAFYARAASVLTIHNMAFQGIFPKPAYFKAGFGWADYTPERMEYYNGFNFLKAGLVYADMVSTVSPTYCREISESPEKGRGLEGVIRARGADCAGILNGIDTEVWDPEWDSYLPRGYDVKSFEKGKLLAKQALHKMCGLEYSADTPCAGVVSRLDYQKGIDLVVKAVESYAGRMKFFILGTGNRALEEQVTGLAKRFPGSVFYLNAHDEAMAHRIYAGCDLFLMPSRFEPCGLSQLIALRYGTLPVASRTGGLADTVRGYADDSNPNGFFLRRIDESAFADALALALALYKDSKKWSTFVRTAMKGDYSWDLSARQYLQLYESAVAKARK